MEKIIKVVSQKDEKSIIQLLLLGFLGGAFIAFGGLLALKISGDLVASPGIVKFVFGALFPLGLILVVMAGAELFTGNTSYYLPALLSKKTTLNNLAKNWIIIYLSNFIGALFVALFLTYLAEALNINQISFIKKIAEAKVSNSFSVNVLRAISCNWLVCLALWMAMKTDSFSGKVLVIWFPIMAFVAMGFEHSIANQFFIPLGMLYGAKITITDFLLNNLLPVTIGNIIGGGLFVGTIYFLINNKNK